jgi:hypothetical protein
METEGSLICAQKNITFLYRKPDKSSSSIYVSIFLVALSFRFSIKI